MRDEVLHAIRSLARSPGFSLLAIGSLALGIGATTAVFSLLNAVYFRPLPFHPSGELAVIELFDDRTDCRAVCKGTMTARELGGWTESLQAIDALAALSPYRAVVSDHTGAAIGQGAAVSTNLMPLLGVRPDVGRLFDSVDDRADADNVTILSHAFWVSRYGSDPAAVGSHIVLNGTPFRVIGVLSASSRIGRPLFTGDTSTAQFFVPLGPYIGSGPDRKHTLTLVARLRRGTPVESLRAQLALLLARSYDNARLTANPSSNGDARRRAVVLPLREAHAQAVASSSYFLLFGVVTFALLIVCANLAGLFLARFHGRRHELVIRAALGATPWQQARYLAIECFLCAGAGGALGVVVAVWAGGLAKFLPARGIPYWTGVTVDGRVLLFAAGLVSLSAITIAAFSINAVRPRRAELSLRGMNTVLTGQRGSGRHQLILIAFEVLLALVLLAGAGLLGKAFLSATARDLGQARSSVLMATVAVREMDSGTAMQQRSLAERLLERLQGLPGIVRAAAHTSGPLFPGLSRDGDRQFLPANPPLSAELVTPDFFHVWSIPLISGRMFNSADGAGASSVAVLDERTAHQLFPEGRVLGRQIRLGDPSSPSPWMTVVGVVGTRARSVFPDTSGRFYPTVYQPLAQSAPRASNVGLVLRTAVPTEAMISVVRSAIHDVAPGAILVAITSVEAQLAQELAPLRLNTIVIGSFAVVSLIIAALGVYGVVAQLAVTRSAEMGLRMAIGAQPREVMRLMLQSTAIATLFGIAGGLAVSLALTRVVRVFLYGEAAIETRVLLGASFLLIVTALVAAYFPARRATRVDPSSALRNL